jgi:hypothetical protein
MHQHFIFGAICINTSKAGDIEYYYFLRPIILFPNIDVSLWVGGNTKHMSVHE